MLAQLGVDPTTALAVVVSTVAIYLTLLVLLRVVGQRSLSAMSATDVACVIALGAVVGRTTLLAVPTLATGVIALVVLFAMQRLLAVLRRRHRVSRVLTHEPVVLMLNGQVRQDALRRARVSDDDLRQRLRLAGVVRREDVRCAVLERNGQISVLRAGTDLDPWLVDDVELYR